MIALRWRVAWFLFFAAGLNYADRTALSSVIPPLRAELGATDVEIGLAGMLFLWSYAIASPFAGYVADRWSRSRIIVLSLVAWSVVTILTGLTPSVFWLLVLRVALGLTESFYLPAGGALLGEHHDTPTRGKAMGFHMLGLNLGLVFGGSAAGLIAEHYGWRLGFWLLGGLGLVLAGTSRLLLGDGPARTGGQAAAGHPRVTLLEACRYLVRVPSFHCLLASAVVAGVASWIFLSWLPLYFAENHAMKLGAAGLAGVALYKGPVFVGIAIGGWLSDRVVRDNRRGRALIKGLSFLTSAPFLFAFMAAASFPVIAAMLVISSILRAVGTPSEHPLICEVVPPQYRATAIGLFNTFGSAAGGVGVLLAGIFKKDLGLSVIFGLSSFLYILAGLLMLLAYRYTMGRDMTRADAATTLAAPAAA